MALPSTSIVTRVTRCAASPTWSQLISVDKVGEAAHLVNRVTIEVEGSAKPACVADVVTRLYF